MLFNFCDPRLRPEIQCSTVSTEGHEATNLITDSDKGFLAYACIKPPVYLDLSFLCNMCINHIIIWPNVGSQKSSGFQLYAKATSDASVPYSLLSTGYLDSSNTGILFYSSNVNHATIPVPPQFLKRYIKPSVGYLTTYISNLRICICKTENSVPALGRIEVWGTVSSRCGKDIVASIYSLWFKQESCSPETSEKVEENVSVTTTAIKREDAEPSLQVPDCFLDAITWEIMTQPILLPSGKIIDQTTLQKHEETEALWGRSLTDPFTGMPFNENRKPVIANSLKIRIDKFLLDNSNAEEIKKLPRVLGHAVTSNAIENKITDIPKHLLKKNVLNKTTNDTKPKIQYPVTNTQEKKKFCHRLPTIVTSSKQSASTLTRPMKKRKTVNSCISLREEVESEEKKDNFTDVVDLSIDSNESFNINTVVPHLKRFNNISEKHDSSSNLNSCACCPTGIFYQLPCKHVLCRKVLIAIEDNHCTLCDTTYKNNEVKRIYE